MIQITPNLEAGISSSTSETSSGTNAWPGFGLLNPSSTLAGIGLP